MTHINLEAVDSDGAIREAAEEVSGDTRLGFLRKGAVAGGAALGGGAILSALVPGAALAKGAPAALVRQGRHRHPELRADARVPRARVLQRGDRQGQDHGSEDQDIPRDHDPRRAGTRRLPEEGPRKARRQRAEVQLRRHPERPDQVRRHRLRAREHRRSCLPWPGRQHQDPRVPAGGRFDRHDRGTPFRSDRLDHRKSISPSGPFDKGWTAPKVLAAVKSTGFIV